MASTIVHEWFDQVWNQGDESAIDRLFHAQGKAHGLAVGDTFEGPEAYKPLLRKFKQAFPDLRIEVVDSVREGDKVAVRCVVRGTHTGEGLDIPPTGRSVEISGITFARERGGQIVEAWNVFDFPTMMAQLAGDAVGSAGKA